VAGALPALSVIVPCTRPRQVRDSLEGLARQSDPSRLEAIVVGDVEALRGLATPFALDLVPCPELHANLRRNLGIERARAERIAFLDDDAVPLPGWLDAALAVDPAGDAIATGPELPLGESPTARLLYAVVCNPWAEGTTAHVDFRAREIGWIDVPFCNAVLPARAFREVGPLSTDVPWDMDDFEFCSRARRRYRFRNDPALRIRHDRYPDRLGPWLRDKWHQRVRIGNKLVTHSGVYGRIPAVVLAAAWPLAALAAALLVPGSLLFWIAAAAAAYALFLALQARPGRRALGVRRLPAYLGVVACLHVITLVGVPWGAARETWRSLRDRGARRAQRGAAPR
jgi:glycosyltransferase involved in cell wall biosynthesis